MMSVSSAQTLVTGQQELIDKYYDARVQSIRVVHDELLILRVVPDAGIPQYKAGQYVTLGLGPFEPRIDGLQSGVTESSKIIQRAYSISCPMVQGNKLTTCRDLSFVEFYITLVNLSDEDRARLTPRLFGLRPGSRIHFGHKITGKYTADPVRPQDNVLLLATGTGEAPHNAMTAELLAGGHRGKITSVACVRFRKDAGYLLNHRDLERLYPSYRYHLVTTREPENLDPNVPGYVGKVYLQDLLQRPNVGEWLGFELDPSKTQVFLCGNPDMIGIPSNITKHVAGEPWQFPTQRGIIEILLGLGFELPAGGHGTAGVSSGNIHFEKYW